MGIELFRESAHLELGAHSSRMRAVVSMAERVALVDSTDLLTGDWRWQRAPRTVHPWAVKSQSRTFRRDQLRSIDRSAVGIGAIRPHNARRSLAHIPIAHACSRPPIQEHSSSTRSARCRSTSRACFCASFKSERSAASVTISFGASMCGSSPPRIAIPLTMCTSVSFGAAYRVRVVIIKIPPLRERLITVRLPSGRDARGEIGPKGSVSDW